MTKILIIAAAFVTTMAASGSVLAADNKKTDYNQHYTNNTKLLPYTYNPKRNKSVRDGGSRHGNYYD